MQALSTLWHRGTDFLGCRYAVMGGAMSWVSEHRLVAAISNEGGFGVIACSAMPPEALRQEIRKTRALTIQPFGVNLIVMHPDLEQLVAVCAEENISHVVLAGGIPSKHTIEAIKAYGGKVLGFAPALAIGKKLLRNGVDALVIEGMEAGGHIGPVSTSVLVQEIIPYLKDEAPVFVAGGIGRGEAIAAYLEMGAAGVQLGTKFVCATESIAHPNFKRAFIKASARNAVPSIQIDPEFPVIPVRAIENKATSDFARVQVETIADYRAGKLDKQQAQLKIEHFWAGSLRRAVIEGDVEHGSLMAGQSVGMVEKEQPVREILAELLEQAEQFLQDKKRH